jgi:hypothetical protein
MKKRSIIILSVVIIIFVLQEIIYVHPPQFIKNYIKELNVSTLAKIKAAQRMSAHSSNQIPNDYLSLFNCIAPINKNKLKFDETLIFNYRYPVSDFTYDTNFCLQLYKIGYVGNLPVKLLVFEEPKKTIDRNNNITFTINQQGLFDFFYNLQTRLNPSKVNLSINGSDTKTLAINDTAAYYRSNLKELAVQFNKYESQDIYIEANYSGTSYENHNNSGVFYTEPAPFEVLFLKRRGELYLILFSVKKPKVNLQSGMLLNILNGKNVE